MQKLYEKDRSNLLDYIMDEPEFNLFIIGDIENFGVDSENVEIFANKINGAYDSIILRYRETYIVYSKTEEYDTKAVADFLTDRKAGMISGKGSIVEKLSPFMPDRKIKRTYLSKLTKTVSNNAKTPLNIRALTPQDAKALVVLYTQIDEFKEDYINNMEKQIDNIKVNLESGHGIGAFDGENLASVAVTSAENTKSAMIIGVATSPNYRKKGLASLLVSSLCSMCLDKGMDFICLFYNNPQAGSIYRRIGFVEIGDYLILK